MFEIAHAYIDELAALDPILATAPGLPDHHHEMTDYSPDGFAAQAKFDRRTLCASDAKRASPAHLGFSACSKIRVVSLPQSAPGGARSGGPSVTARQNTQR